LSCSPNSHRRIEYSRRREHRTHRRSCPNYSTSMHVGPNTLVRMALPPIRTPPRSPRPPRHGTTKRTKHSQASSAPESKSALESKSAQRVVDAAARGGDADLLALLSGKFWTRAVEARTPAFLVALRRGDPERWRLVTRHLKQFNAIRGLLLAEVAKRATRTHATWRLRSPAVRSHVEGERTAYYHFADGRRSPPAQ